MVKSLVLISGLSLQSFVALVASRGLLFDGEILPTWYLVAVGVFFTLGVFLFVLVMFSWQANESKWRAFIRLERDVSNGEVTAALSQVRDSLEKINKTSLDTIQAMRADHHKTLLALSDGQRKSYEAALEAFLTQAYKKKEVNSD